MKAGPYEVRALCTDAFRLDGGAMFGNVPKVLWERHHPADDKNRIPMVTRVIVARGDERVILVDTGTGHLWSDKECSMYGLSAPEEPGVVTALRRAGFEPEEVTDVILTHLHFDHAGGVTRRGPKDEPVPTFPRARVHVQAANWATARDPNERERRSYLKRHWQPLEGDRLHLVEGPAEILPAVHVTPSNGHTHGLQWVRFGDEEGSVVFAADMLPLATHVNVPWTMGYDLCPRELMDEKRGLLETAERGGWTLVFEHDPETEAAGVASEAGRFGITTPRRL